MSTPLTDSINALTAYANEVTGASDTTLSDAVGRLCEGYGEGSELYPVGTDLVTKYIGRNLSNGYGLFVLGNFSETTGEIIEGSEAYGISTVYIPINPDYTYYKTRTGRFYKACLYDADYNFIGMSREQNNLSFKEISPFPSNARYMRIRTHSLNNNWDIAILRTA